MLIRFPFRGSIVSRAYWSSSGRKLGEWPCNWAGMAFGEPLPLGQAESIWFQQMRLLWPHLKQKTRISSSNIQLTAHWWDLQMPAGIAYPSISQSMWGACHMQAAEKTLMYDFFSPTEVILPAAKTAYMKGLLSNSFRTLSMFKIKHIPCLENKTICAPCLDNPTWAVSPRTVGSKKVHNILLPTLRLLQGQVFSRLLGVTPNLHFVALQVACFTVKISQEAKHWNENALCLGIGRHSCNYCN
jgi:hypothetical protein